MIAAGAFAAFALGLRHGADPDHLAAIDNLTRNSYDRNRWLSRCCGALFAGGHSVMVLAIATIVGLVGAQVAGYGNLFETVGTVISIVVLVAIAALNLAQLRSGDGRLTGIKTRLIPPLLRNATSAWAAVPTGLLFGFGFETSSQIVTYTIALGSGAGWLGALTVGAAFCAGMTLTDTLDSVIVHRLVADRSALRASTVRVWIVAVSAIAIGVALYETAQLFGWHSPLPDIYASATIVSVVLALFSYVYACTRKRSLMKRKRLIGTLAATLAIAAGIALYAVHPAWSSDHQDTYNLANRSNTSADITDVYVFPAPDNANNVVLAMDVSPLIPAGMGTAKFFDPTLIWQLKIAHGAANYQEDQVIQFAATGTGSSQTISMYGPAAPNEVGTVNTLLPTVTGTTAYNSSSSLPNGISLFAGPRADPFFFDLFAFFTFLGDRNFGTHASQSDVGPGDTLFNGDNAGIPAAVAPAYDKSANATTPSFNGFASGTMSSNAAGAYACSTNASQNALADIGGGFNVLSFVVEVPRSLIYGGNSGFSSSVIHVWATANSSTGT